MQIESLVEFYTLSEIRNYTVAAEHLFLTEATLSRHIKKLEEELGGQLFIRSTRRIELTDFGRALLPSARKAMELNDEISSTVNQMSANGKSQINIATIAVSSEYINLTSLLSLFNRHNPRISINLFTIDRPAEPMIANGECDIGLIPELADSENNNIDRILVRRDHLIALIPRNHPLASSKSLSIEDLKDEKLLLISNGSPVFSLCIETCRMHGFSPRVILTMASGSNIRNMVEQEMGIGLLLEYPSIKLHNDFPYAEKLVFRHFDPQIAVNFNMVCSRNPSAEAREFISFFRDIIRLTPQDDS